MSAPGSLLIDLSLRAFVDRAAEPTPEPGGGSVAALVGALGAGLATMVCALTIGRPKYAEVGPDLERRRHRLIALRHELAALVDADVQAYGQVMAAYQLPKSTEAERTRRDAAVAAGLISAIGTPLDLAKAGVEVIDHALAIARVGNRTATDDALMGALLAETAARGALLNVTTNLRLLRPERTPAGLADRVAGLRAAVAERSIRVQAEIGGAP